MTLKDLINVNPLRCVFSFLLEGASAALVVLETYFLTIQFDKIKSHDYYGFLFLAILQILSFILSSGFKQLGDYLWSIQVQKYFHNIRKDFLYHVVNSKVMYTPDMVQNQLVKNLSIIKEGYTDPVKDTVYQLTLLLFITTTLLHLQWEIFLVALVWSIIQLYFPKVFDKKLRRAYDRLSNQNKKYLKTLNNWLIGLNEIRRYTAVNHLFRVLGTASKKVENSSIEKSKIDQQIEYLNTLIYTIGDSVLFIITAIFVIFNHSNFGLIASITSFNFYLFGSLMHISGYRMQINGTKEIRSNLITSNNKVEIYNSNGSNPCGFKLEKVRIMFSNNKFISYPDLTVNPGEKILLTGESGSGKTTLFKLLLDELIPNKGKITYFNKENKEIVPDYSKIGYLPQDPILIPGTILDNIIMFNSKLIPFVSKISQEVQLTGEFNNGVNTNLDLNRENYSGGQKQKIILARGLMHDSNLLLIDEGTSAIDQAATLKIIKKLVKTKKTIIFIAHNLTPEIKQLFDRTITLNNK